MSTAAEQIEAFQRVFFILRATRSRKVEGALLCPLAAPRREQVAHGDPKTRVARSTSALYYWLPESVLSTLVAVRDRGSEQRRSYDPHLFPHLPTPSIQLTRQAVSYVSRRRMDAVDFDPDEVDEEGLPLVYNEDRINAFWSARLGELAGRWATFARISAPWLTRLATAVVRGTLERDRAALARDAVDNLEKLGPTYVKLGQILVYSVSGVGEGVKEKERGEREEEEEGEGRTSLSPPLRALDAREFLSRPPKIRITLTPPLATSNHAQTTHRYSPDVLPPDVMDELARLQDNIKSFSTVEARAIIEADMGQPIDVLFSEFSPAPIAAASLAQVRSIVLWLFH